MEQSFDLAERGMQRALAHAESEVPTWASQADAFLKAYAMQNEQFTGYLVVLASELDPTFPVPPTAKAWGQIFRTAVKRGVIENSGRTMLHPKRHGGGAIVWTSLVFA